MPSVSRKASLVRPAQSYELRARLAHVQPAVWRRLRVPGSMPLDRLDLVFQRAFGWNDTHMHEWTIGKQRYGIPDPDALDDDPVTPGRGVLLRAVGAPGTRFLYVYDFGDDWRVVEVEAIEIPAEPLRYAHCVDGARADPPDDCGGPYGYADLLAALRDPSHPEHESYREWADLRFAPEGFDAARINRKLRGL